MLSVLDVLRIVNWKAVKEELKTLSFIDSLKIAKMW